MTYPANAEGQERLSLLARMTSLFASGMDLDATLRGVVELFVPDFAVGAAVDLLEGGTLRRVASATSLDGDENDAALAELRHQGQSLESDQVRAILTSGTTHIVNIDSAADYPWPPRSASYDALFQRMFPLSVVFAPLRAHGETLGLMQMVTVKGSRRYTAADADVVSDIAQRAAFAIHNARLVTRLQHELALRAETVARLEDTERSNRSLFEGSPVPLWIFDRATMRFLAVNSAAIASYGYSRDEFLSMSILDIRPANEVQRVRDIVSKGRAGVHHLGTFTHVRKDGSLLYAEIHSHDTEFEGRPARMVQAYDVTERVRAFDALRVSEERYRLISRVTKEAIWEWNPESGEVQWNASIYDLFLFSASEVVPTLTWFESRIHPDDLASVREALDQALQHQLESITRRYRFRRGDGTYAMVEGRTVFSWANGVAERVIGSITDITVEQQVGEQLAIAQRMEAVGRLAGGVAHDFNNLLTAIRGFASFALDEQLPSSRAREDIEQILQASDRAAALTRQLLAFSRRQVLQPQLVSVNEILGNLQKMLARVLGEDVEVQTFFDRDLSAVLVDPGQLEQVIMNLVVNARDAMPDGGLLTIETANVMLDEEYAEMHVDASAGEHVMIAITDSGVGMDATTMSRIFEPFFSTKDRDRGTGLGLATSYGIIRQSGGHIWVYSEPGKGSTFKVYLPRAADDDSPTPREIPEPATRLSGNETVLVVEDDDRVRRVSTGALTRHGYHVLEARSAESALQLFRTEKDRIDMIVTDIVLPRMSGLALVQEMRQLKPEVRVLYVSGYTENAFLQAGTFDAGMELLEKPFAPEALVRRVRSILDRKPSA